MFEFIRGTLVRSSVGRAVVETSSGVGYQLHIPPRLELPPVGSELLFYISFVVREQSQTLYGFVEMGQRDLFELLTSISGVGPKIALALIGHTTLSELQKAIQKDDSTPLCRVPGIGKKSASRILVEMRDKVDHLFDVAEPSTTGDAISALIHLGYSRTSAQEAVERAVKRSKGELELQLLITEALKS